MAIALGTAFARLNAGSSSVKRMFKGSVGIWNADAADWTRRVQANGGAVSTSTANAVTDFCNAIDAAGIRDRFYRLNLFCGTGGLNACLVPLYRGPSLSGTQYGNATDTNVGPFSSGDYVETGAGGGLQGNGSTKRLDTGVSGSELSPGNRHVSSYEIVNATTNYAASVLSGSANATMHGIGPWTEIVTICYRTFNAIGGNIKAPKAAGYWLGNDTSTTASVLYRNGSSVASATGQNAGASGNTEYSILGRPAQYSDARLGGYTIGVGITAEQGLSLYNAMQVFQTALGRNV
jgi:hypothetical protein